MDATRSTLHRQIAYVPGDVTLWPSLTGGETIDLLARMRGGIDETAPRRAHRAVRPRPAPRRPRTYSKGNRQKVSLVSAFSSHARLLLLDEPSTGLDPLMENVFQQCVAEARDRGATVLLSSHILAETEALCERVTIIRAGRTVESGTLESMRHLSRTSIKAEMIGDARRSRAGHRRRRGRQRRRPHAARPGRRRKPRRGDQGARRRRRAQPGQPAADAGGPVPAALRHRRHPDDEPETGDGMSTILGPPAPSPAHQAPATGLQLLGNRWAASALPAPRPHRVAAVGAAAVGPAGHRVRRQHRGRLPDRRPTARRSPRPSWPAPRSGRSTARSTTTASVRSASGRPACSTC